MAQSSSGRGSTARAASGSTVRACTVRGRTVRRHGTRARVVAAVLGAVLLFSGCAAGQRAATSIETAVVDGVAADVGPIGLRDVTIAPPALGSYAPGTDARVQLVISNQGPADKLVGVSVAKTVAAGAALFADNTSAIEAPPIATGSSSAPASASASATPSASASAAVSGSIPSIDLASGENTFIGLADSQPQIQLMGVVNTLYPATSIQLTFTFANAGNVTVWVAVHLSTGVINAPTLPIAPSDAD